jgi:hypothetical protein
MSKVLDAKKAQAISHAVNQHLARLNGSTIEKIAEPQLDKLHAMKFTLTFVIDATKDRPEVGVQLTYGGQKYKELL